MAWSKGAVVIKKTGDEAWANEMERIVNTPKTKDQKKEELERDNEWMKKHIVEDLESKIMDAEINYGYNFIPPKWARPIFEGIALIEYGLALFVDKYMTIKEE
jgi:hypothetical protein